MLFGVPDRDLNRTWRNGNTINSIPGQLPLLVEADSARQRVRENRTLLNNFYCFFLSSVYNINFCKFVIFDICTLPSVGNVEFGK